VSTPCNAVTMRYAARSAWSAVAGSVVGLYLATDRGVIFASIPTKVWAESIAAGQDANGNMLPVPAAGAVSNAQLATLRADLARLQEQLGKMRQEAYDKDLALGALQSRIGLIATRVGVSATSPADACLSAIDIALANTKADAGGAAELKHGELSALQLRYNDLNERYSALNRMLVPLQKRCSAAEKKLHELEQGRATA
jgi:hypothetical protein